MGISVDDAGKLSALNTYLFKDNGFHGSRTNYYSRSNSYMNEVIDDREGLPITLCVLYLELGRRIGLRLEGVGLPGRFVVRHVQEQGKGQLIDVFEGGQLIDRQRAGELVQSAIGKPMTDADLKAYSKEQIILRMIRNLLGVSFKPRSPSRVLPYLDAILALQPDDWRMRWARAELRAQAGRYQAAMEDTSWLLEHHPPQVDLRIIRRLHQQLKNQ